MNRKDFRPNDSRAGGMSDKDRALIQSNKQRTTNRNGVVNDFLDGKKAKTGNESLSTDGDKLKSYNTVIATKQKDGTIVLNNTKYSSTTSRQQSELVREMNNRHVKYDVTGGKDRGYEGEDFSNTDRLRKYNYDVNNPEYKKEIEQENKASKEYKQLAKENPQDKKKLNEISKEEKTHAKELKQLERKDDGYTDSIGHKYEDRQHFIESNQQQYYATDKPEYKKLSTSEKEVYLNKRRQNFSHDDSIRYAKEQYSGDNRKFSRENVFHKSNPIGADKPKYKVTGKTRDGKQFKPIYTDNPRYADGINLYNGSVYEYKNGKYVRIKRVTN